MSQSPSSNAEKKELPSAFNHKSRHNWFNEAILDGFKVSTAITGFHHSAQSKFQFVEIMDTAPFGKCLVLDGHMQSSAKDEFIYHESLVHSAMLSHPNPKQVYIMGGGEGATLREVLRHKSVERCVMVDIDQIAVECSMEHLKSHHNGAFEDPRTQLVFDDAKAWLENDDTIFDVIVMDLADPVDDGPCYLLYTVEFFKFVLTKLSPNGVLVTQAGPAGFVTANQVFTAINKTLQQVFKYTKPTTSHVPAFYDMYGYVIASNVELPDLSGKIDDLIASRLDSPEELKFLDDEAYRGLVALPKHLRQLLAEETRTITNDSPLFIV